MLVGIIADMHSGGESGCGFGGSCTASGKLELRRAAYDIEKVIEDMLAAHLPEKLAFRLRAGRWR